MSIRHRRDSCSSTTISCRYMLYVSSTLYSTQMDNDSDHILTWRTGMQSIATTDDATQCVGFFALYNYCISSKRRNGNELGT